MGIHRDCEALRDGDIRGRKRLQYLKKLMLLHPNSLYHLSDQMVLGLLQTQSKQVAFANGIAHLVRAWELSSRKKMTPRHWLVIYQIIWPFVVKDLVFKDRGFTIERIINLLPFKPVLVKAFKRRAGLYQTEME